MCENDSKYVWTTIFSLREFFEPFLELNSFFLELNHFLDLSNNLFMSFKHILLIHNDHIYLWEFSLVSVIFRGLKTLSDIS